MDKGNAQDETVTLLNQIAADAQANNEALLSINERPFYLVPSVPMKGLTADENIKIITALIVSDEIYSEFVNSDTCMVYWNFCIPNELVETKGLMLPIMEARDLLKPSGLYYESYLNNFGRQLFYVISGSYTTLYMGFTLKAAFYTAIQDDCIRKNPFDFQLNTVIEDDTEPKVPLTPAQEESFLSFAQNDKVYQKYYDELIILLGTGLRISELCGLTDTDINFENRIINVDHQLLRSAETGYYIETPKTKSGIRQIPMSEKVYEAFNRVLKRRRGAKAVTIDGYSNFLFLNRDGYPKTATNYDGMFRGLAKKYNKYHEEALPKVMTPHTFCCKHNNFVCNSNYF